MPKTTSRIAGNQSESQAGTEVPLSAEPAVAFLMSLLPVRDFRVEFSSPHAAQYASDPKQQAAIDELGRTLFRSRQRQALLTGPPGVGRTAVMEMFAQRVCRGDFPFLIDASILYLDVTNVGSEDSRACVESLFAAVQERSQVILCIDGFVSLL